MFIELFHCLFMLSDVLGDLLSLLNHLSSLPFTILNGRFIQLISSHVFMVLDEFCVSWITKGDRLFVHVDSDTTHFENS